MNITPGTKLGRYEIRSKIGEGGMGEVYLAQDTTELDRTVALKILPVEVAADKHRLRRFTQEARTVSNLNHPNILTIYEFGQAGSTCFIATEFIEGETLRQYVSGRRLKLADVLEVAAQIVAALNAAHEAGVVHRDLKPENVMVRRDHIVKVLDFGLAKLSEPPAARGPERGSAGSPADQLGWRAIPAGVDVAGGSSKAETNEDVKTKVLVHTEPGLVMGTVSYMSPEQSVGSGVDRRTDIWSAGVLLYEMLAGVVPFEGKDIHRQIIAIQEQEPAPLSHHVEGVPARLEEIVVKCLAKDKDERYQTAKDLLIDLRNLKRRLDVDAEIERTVAPEFRTTIGGGGTSRPPTQSSQPDAGATNAVPLRMTSSAEYLVGQVQQHKMSALIAVGVLVLAIAATAYYLHARNTEVAIESIAVLPFVNQNHDADSEYLSDGVTESIINSLTQLPNLKVIARSSVFRYKGKETDPLVVGKELGVRAVLTGRILQRGDNLTISAELVDVRDNKQLWGEQYSEKMSDLLSVQREIATKITGSLRLKLSSAEQSRVAKHYTDNPEAYQLYLKGRYFWNKRTSDGIKKSIEYFNQAIEKDLTYALAYAGLADAYDVLPSYSQTPSKEVYPKAKAAAMKALALDDNVAEAHTSLAMVRFWYDWGAGAEPEFKRALELNPNYATGHHWYALYLSAMGRHNEAIAEMKRAQELDPFSIIINTELGLPYLYARQYDQAIEQFKKAIEMDPTFAFAHFGLGEAYDRKGKYQEAIAEHQKAIELAHGEVPPAWSVLTGQLQEAYKASGEKGYWQKRLDLTKRLHEQGAATAEAVAEIYAILGDKDQAFAWLEKSYQQHEDSLVFINTQAAFDSLHSDPRFAELMRRIGLPQ